MHCKVKDSLGTMGVFMLVALVLAPPLVFAAPSNRKHNPSISSGPKARGNQSKQKVKPPVSTFPDLSLEPIFGDEPIPPIGFPLLPSSIELPFEVIITRTNIEPPAIHSNSNFQEIVDKANENLVTSARNSLKQAPTAEAHLLIGRILSDRLYAGRDVRQAYYHLRKAVELDGDSQQKLPTAKLAEAHKILAELLKDAAYDAKHRDELHTFGMRLRNSYIEFRRAVELNPGNADLKRNLLEVTKEAVKAFSSYANYLALGYAYYLVGDNASAMGAYQMCKYYEPDSSELAKAILRVDTKNTFPLESTSRLNNDGAAALNGKKFRSAISKFELALKIDPRYSLAKSNLVTAYNNFAIELAKQGKRTEAVEIFRQAVAIAPDDKTASSNLQSLIDDEKKKDDSQKKSNAATSDVVSRAQEPAESVSSSSDQKLEQVHKALAQMETKAFSKTFESDDLLTRFSRLEQKLLGKEQQGTLMKRIDALLILQ